MITFEIIEHTASIRKYMMDYIMIYNTMIMITKWLCITNQRWFIDVSPTWQILVWYCYQLIVSICAIKLLMTMNLFSYTYWL